MEKRSRNTLIIIIIIIIVVVVVIAITFPVALRCITGLVHPLDGYPSTSQFLHPFRENDCCAVSPAVL